MAAVIAPTSPLLPLSRMRVCSLSLSLLACSCLSTVAYASESVRPQQCVALLEEHPGRAWALSRPEAPYNGQLVQHFELDFVVGTEADEGLKPLATFEFPEPVVLTSVEGGGRATITKCDFDVCPMSVTTGGQCLSWCNAWTCSSAECLGCGESVGCHTPPSPPSPSPPPRSPGMHGITLTVLSLEEWEERRSRGGDGEASPAYQQTVLQRKIFGGRQRATGPGLIELRGFRRRPIGTVPHLEDVTLLMTPRVKCHNPRDFAAFEAIQLPFNPPPPPPPFPKGKEPPAPLPSWPMPLPPPPPPRPSPQQPSAMNSFSFYSHAEANDDDYWRRPPPTPPRLPSLRSHQPRDGHTTASAPPGGERDGAVNMTLQLVELIAFVGLAIAFFREPIGAMVRRQRMRSAAMVVPSEPKPSARPNSARPSARPHDDDDDDGEEQERGCSSVGVSPSAHVSCARPTTNGYGGTLPNAVTFGRRSGGRRGMVNNLKGTQAPVCRCASSAAGADVVKEEGEEALQLLNPDVPRRINSGPRGGSTDGSAAVSSIAREIAEARSSASGAASYQTLKEKFKQQVMQDVAERGHDV